MRPMLCWIKVRPQVYAYITHGVLSAGQSPASPRRASRSWSSPIPIQPTQAVRVSRNIRVLSVASLIGEAIGRTAAEELVSSLFN